LRSTVGMEAAVPRKVRESMLQDKAWAVSPGC
jgi:hypothetical protein